MDKFNFIEKQKKKILERNLANLIFNKSFSNIFITLCDLDNKVIISKSSGSAKAGFLKKQKKSPQAIEFIVKSLIPFLEYHNIKKLNIILKVRFSIHISFLIKELLANGFIIKYFTNKLKIAHSLIRGRKIRRV